MQRQTARMLLISAVALVVLFSAGEVNGQSCSSEGYVRSLAACACMRYAVTAKCSSLAVRVATQRTDKEFDIK